MPMEFLELNPALGWYQSLDYGFSFGSGYFELNPPLFGTNRKQNHQIPNLCEKMIPKLTQETMLITNVQWYGFRGVPKRAVLDIGHW